LKQSKNKTVSITNMPTGQKWFYSAFEFPCRYAIRPLARWDG